MTAQDAPDQGTALATPPAPRTNADRHPLTTRWFVATRRAQLARTSAPPTDRDTRLFLDALAEGLADKSRAEADALIQQYADHPVHAFRLGRFAGFLLGRARRDERDDGRDGRIATLTAAVAEETERADRVQRDLDRANACIGELARERDAALLAFRRHCHAGERVRRARDRGARYGLRVRLLAGWAALSLLLPERRAPRA